MALHDIKSSFLPIDEHTQFPCIRNFAVWHRSFSRRRHQSSRFPSFFHGQFGGPRPFPRSTSGRRRSRALHHRRHATCLWFRRLADAHFRLVLVRFTCVTHVFSSVVVWDVSEHSIEPWLVHAMSIEPIETTWTPEESKGRMGDASTADGRDRVPFLGMSCRQEAGVRSFFSR